MKRLISFFEIPAIDLDRAVKFYEIILNVKLSVMECDTEKMAFFPEEEGVYPGAISFAETFKPTGGGVLISLHIEDMDKTIRLIEDHKGKILIPKTKILDDKRGFFCTFTDSEGNQIGLYSEK